MPQSSSENMYEESAQCILSSDSELDQFNLEYVPQNMPGYLSTKGLLVSTHRKVRCKIQVDWRAVMTIRYASFLYSSMAKVGYTWEARGNHFKVGKI